MSENITISTKEYVRLLVIEEQLTRLYAGGVDDWEWHGESLNPDNAPDMDEFKKKLRTEYGI